MCVKRYIFNFSVIIFLLFSATFLSAQEAFRIRHVVIDAGHGGKDPGAVGKTTKEKDIALAISLKLGKYITDNFKDVKVTYTRDKDVFVELHMRAKIANAAKADLFISVHCNAVDGNKAIGTETWVMGNARNARNLRVAQKENASILLETNYNETYENFDPYSPASYIRYSIIQSDYKAQSLFLAGHIQDQFTNRVHRVNRGVKENIFLVLVNTAMPSVLIEAGFLSNPTEEKFLKSENGQDLLASAIYRAFKDYKKHMEAGAAKSNALPTPTPVRVDTGKVVESNKVVVNASDVTEDSEKLIIGVQFATTSQKKSIQSFGSIEKIWFYEQSSLFKYVSGKYTTFEKAEAQLSKLKSEGYKDAFLVYFYKGERIRKKSDALKLMK